MNIVIEFAGLDFWYAYIPGQREKAQCGESPSSAIGKLLWEQSKSLGVIFTKMRNVNGESVESDDWPERFH